MTDAHGRRAIRVRIQAETTWSRAAAGLLGMLERAGHPVAECAPGNEPDLIVFGDRVRNIEASRRPDRVRRATRPRSGSATRISSRTPSPPPVGFCAG